MHAVSTARRTRVRVLAKFRPGFGIAAWLLLSAGSATAAAVEFENVTAAAGLEEAGTDMCAWADYDGDQDLYVSNYRLMPNLLWVNDGRGCFTDQARQRGVYGDATAGKEPASGYYPEYEYTGHTIGSIWGDLNSDGDLDLLAAGQLVRNRGNANAWIQVKVIGGGGSNLDGVGARVQVAAGPLVQMREVVAGNSGNQDPLLVHFGLGDWSGPVRVRVDFPSGRSGAWIGQPRTVLVAGEDRARSRRRPPRE